MAIATFVAFAANVHAVERVIGPIELSCPGADPSCVGTCTFAIRLSYDVDAVTSAVTNLKLRFDVRCTGEVCRGSFDGGRGFIRYETVDGRTLVLHQVDLQFEEELRRDTLTPADAATLQRLEQRRCHTWTPQEMDWWRAHAVPTSLNGWTLTWGCQQTEDGRSGMSVTEIQADQGARIRRFEVLFDILIHTACHGQRRSRAIQVREVGP
jgi:hypothetical protein